MKNLKLFAFTILVGLFMTTNVNAQTVSTESELLECVKNNGTCTLANDIDLEERLIIEADKTIVLDLNTKTLNINKVLENNWPVFVKGSLTIQGNGIINITNHLGIGVYKGTLVVKNGTFNQTTGDYIISNWGTTTIENGTFNGDYCAVNGLEGNTVIKNGTFNTKPHGDYGSEDDTLFYWGILFDEGNGAKLEVQKGTFNQILSWPNVLADDAEVTYILERENVIYDPIEIKGNVTIDLNGQSVVFDENSIEKGEDSLFTVLRGGKLTINDSKGNGKITAGNNSKVYSAVKLTKKGETENGELAELVVNNGTLEGYYYGIVGNGTRHDTKITINNGTVKGANASDNLGIFHPQDGELVVNGGTIEGLTGIEMRAGDLIVNGGTITGTSKKLTSVPNGSGSTINGAGIGVSQHTTGKDINVVVKGGTIKGMSAVYQVNPQKLGEEGYNKVSVSLLGGTFATINEGENVVYSENDRVEISGGTYSNDVKDYVSEGLVSKKDGDNYVVGKEYEVKVNTLKNGKLTVDKTKVFAGETITMTITPNEKFGLELLKVVDATNKAIEVTNNTFVMPESDVTITAEFVEIIISADIPVIDTEEEVEEVVVGVTEDSDTEEVLLDSLRANEELVEKIKDTSVNVVVEVEKVDETKLPEETKKAIEEKAGKATITEFFDISVIVKNAKDNSEIDKISELTEEIELMILLPEDLKNTKEDVTRKYYVIREHEGKVDALEAKLSKDGKYLTFKSDSFSTYALAYEDVEVEKVESPQTGDTVITSIIISMISLIAFASAGLYLKKRFN